VNFSSAAEFTLATHAAPATKLPRKPRGTWWRSQSVHAKAPLGLFGEEAGVAHESALHPGAARFETKGLYQAIAIAIEEM